MNINNRTILRFDTLANWQSVNPILLKGELAVINDTSQPTPTCKIKCGDGQHNFNDLPFICGDGASSGLNILGRNKEYAVGDIAYSPNLPSWAYLECITAGTTGDTDPTLIAGGVILNQEITDNTVVFKLRNIGLLSYPIGSIYQSTNSTNPSNIFGGTWSQIKDRFLLACGDSYSNGSVGGEASHTLTINEIPSHAHRVYVFTGNSNNSGNYTAQYIDTSNNTLITATFGAKLTHGWNSSSFKTWGTTLGDGTGDPAGNTGYTGGSSAHNNMPPYFAIYTWYRTA